MKFFRPTSLADLLRLKKEHAEARLIAGATELGLDITKRYKKFPTLISTEAVAELKEIKSTATEWHIGAAVTLTEIKDRLGQEFSGAERHALCLRFATDPQSRHHGRQHRHCVAHRR